MQISQKLRHFRVWKLFYCPKDDTRCIFACKRSLDIPRAGVWGDVQHEIGAHRSCALIDVGGPSDPLLYFAPNRSLFPDQKESITIPRNGGGWGVSMATGSPLFSHIGSHRLLLRTPIGCERERVSPLCERVAFRRRTLYRRAGFLPPFLLAVVVFLSVLSASLFISRSPVVSAVNNNRRHDHVR